MPDVCGSSFQFVDNARKFTSSFFEQNHNNYGRSCEQFNVQLHIKNAISVENRRFQPAPPVFGALVEGDSVGISLRTLAS